MLKNVVAALALVAIGCGGDLDDIEASELALDEAVDEIVDNLVLAGFPESEIEIHEDGVVFVGGDAEVSLQASREMIGLEGDDEGDAQDQFRQYRSNNMVDSSVQTICVDGAQLEPYGVMSSGLDQAIARYNARNTRLELIRTSGSTNGCDAGITAYAATGYYAGNAWAGFPSGGLPHGAINIGVNLTGYGLDIMTHIIVHELGHCIGFRHTDYFDRSISCGGWYDNEGDAGYGAVHIPNTPTGASLDGSVMNACFNYGSTGVLTSSDITAMHQLYGCGEVGHWASGTSPTPWFDTANCYVADVPAGVTPFIYANLWHTTTAPSCPMGSYDGANCYIQSAPAGQFIYANGFYTVPTYVNGAPVCPAGTNFDGANCHWFNAPAGTSAFLYAGGWYTTPAPSCPMGAFDGANCYVGAPPGESTAFIHGGGFLYSR